MTETILVKDEFRLLTQTVEQDFDYAIYFQ